jgi:hypothetical protein
VQKSYSAFGSAENIQFTEDFGKHESTKNNRETLYAFFQKNLQLPGDNSDNEIKPFTVEELQVTSTGQVATSLKGETVFGLNRKYFKEEKVAQNVLKEKITETAGIDFNLKLTAAVFTGKILTENFEVKKYFLENDKKDYALPVYVISKPNSKTTKNLVWLPEEGKEQILDSPLLAEFLNAGYTLISADLPGVGELLDQGFSGDGFVQKVPFNYTFGANLVGKSIAGIQAEAIDLLVQFIQKDFPGTETDAFSEGIMSSPLLHFSVLKNSFRKIVLQNTLESNVSLIQTEYYSPKLAYGVVPGSLSFYDFKDLVSLLPSNSVKIINPVNALGEKTEDNMKESEILKFLNKQ